MIRLTPEVVSPVRPEQMRYCVMCKYARRIDQTYKKEIGCALYQTVDLVTGNIAYDNAFEVRQNEQACGILGRHYQPVTPTTFYKECATDELGEENESNENSEKLGEQNDVRSCEDDSCEL